MLHHKNPITRAKEDKERCHGIVAGSRQCNLTQVPGSKFCPVHGGNKFAENQVKQSLYNFRNDQYKARFAALSESNSIKNLRDEIAIVRLIVQKHIDITSDLIGMSSQFSKLIRTIASLADACTTIEKKLQDVMDRTAATDIIAAALNSLKSIPDELYNDVIILMGTMIKSETIKSQLQLPRWNEQINTLLTNDKIISLRGEIGVLRIILEEKMNAAHDDQELLLASSSIIETITDIKDIVLSCHRVETSQGLLFTDSEATAFSQKLIEIIANHVNPDELKDVADVFEKFFSENDC